MAPPFPPASSATAPTDPAAQPPGAPAGIYVELRRNGKVERFEPQSELDSAQPSTAYGEILEPNGDTRFILWASNRTTLFHAIGYGKRLPGSLTRVMLRLQQPGSTAQTESTQAQLTVSKFGAEGEFIEGTFKGQMVPHLNQEPEKIEGRFRVRRKPDRFDP